MDEIMSTSHDPRMRRKRLAIFVVALVILLTLAFGAGFTLGQQDVKTPIIIEKNSL